MSITRLVPIRDDKYTVEVHHSIHVMDLLHDLHAVGYTLSNTGHETYELRRTIERVVPILKVTK